MMSAKKMLSAGFVAAALVLCGAAPSVALTPEEIFNYKGPDRQK